jgi:hypothetical protein
MNRLRTILRENKWMRVMLSVFLVIFIPSGVLLIGRETMLNLLTFGVWAFILYALCSFVYHGITLAVGEKQEEEHSGSIFDGRGRE